MSNKRHKVHACPKLPSPVSTLVYDFAHGHVIPEHFHPEDQLVYASRGVMTVRTEEGTWVVPPRRAVWIPAKTAHSIVMSGPVSMRTLYLRARMARNLPRNCCVVNVSRLLQELILHACQFPAMNRRVKAHAHLIDLILDQLETVRAIPSELTSPVDPRALRVAAILQRDPSETRSLAALCREVGASKRTIECLFERETSLSWANGDSDCGLCVLCSNWLPEKRSPAPLLNPATALPAHSLRCFGKRWEPPRQ